MTMTTGAIEDILTLTPTQLGLLFETLSAPRGGVYILQATARLRGAIDTRAFALACREIVLRHAALRASIHWHQAERAVQVIHAHVDVPLAIVDWSGDDRHDARLAEFLAADRERGIEM